ncbi:MAG: TolC family protein [Phycisphaerales bacterium]|nr:TolC family protein [Planctomycetota bacterium]MBL6997975.1 TolC family protein [Phycisphaerales bacterium]
MQLLLCRITYKYLRTTIYYSSALLLTGCAASIDATRDVQSAHLLAMAHLPVVIEEEQSWSADKPLSVDMAIAYAMTHDAILQRELAIIVQRRAEIAQAELPANPTITGSFGIAVDGLSGAPLVLQGIQNLSWLWTRPDRIASAEQTLRQAILTAANRTVGVVANVRIAHHEVTTGLKLIQLANEDVDLASKILEITKKHVSAGEAAETEIDSATITFLNSKHNLSKLQEQFDISLLNLLHTMGCPETQNVFIVAQEPKPTQIHHSEESLLAYAIENRLDLAAQRATIEQRSAELGLANPPLISGSFMLNENFNGREAVSPGVGVTIALDGDAKEAVAQSKLKQEELSYIDSMRTVIRDVRTLFDSFMASIEQSSLDETVLLTTETSLKRALEASNRGELDPLLLLQMERSSIQAKQELLRDELLVSTNAIKLEQAVGGTFKGMNQ